ncbi:hypothetical protein GUITHDRAFT_141168 [Guillardia theta CCMP2712]|uniref:RING-type domain-containing protein n=1 Tax=Guillardia theta (strain CCMP2712) TaxID=905079 RepID=L1J324_GUITC|nr:hypothetical protein GUITHDRAFT_141168 [Guillardia theta CCMP2712]EKX42495.1 hypothetical protein GUITHDRAFT_141168 [Guillardia theta CCMP2712]|eukprot:XP_005829475.1 hypothetical protein GUITHDRAFT_141168 [Guillardia theta CCMP2712]
MAGAGGKVVPNKPTPIFRFTEFEGRAGAHVKTGYQVSVRDASRINLDAPVNVIQTYTALQSSAGSNLGLNLSVTGNILSLAFVGNAMFSSNAAAGRIFYQPTNSIQTYSVSADATPTTAASSDMVCYSLANTLKCYILGYTVTGMSWNDVALYSPCSKVQCTAGNPMSLWRSVIAYSGTTPTGRRYVQVSAAKSSQGSYSISCLGGCGYSTDVMTSSDPTFGTSVALSENFLAIGCPGNNYVRVLKASGTLVPTDPYSSFTLWTLFNTFVGSANQNFGQQLSISSTFLIVGAPGTFFSKGAITVYRVDGSTNVSKFCEITDSHVGSLFGFSIAQTSSSNGLTFAVIGAPGSNLAHVVALRQFPYTCEVRNTLSPDSSDFLVNDQFGYSVAINSQSIYVGSPYYARYFNPGISGLLYIFSYCNPGSAIPPFYRDCSACPVGQTSNGGASSCITCTLPLPQHATYGAGCTTICDPGYFGSSCLPCSQYAPAQGMTNPLKSSWVDNQPTCTWQCNAGYQRVNDDGCAQCQNDIQFNQLSNVEWIPGTCSWRCKATYFSVNQTQNFLDCKLCSQYKAALGQPPPANAEWLDRFNECKYVPLPGYSCQSGTCTACSNSKPQHSHWLTVNDRYSSPSQSVTITSLCEYACDQTFFIAPTSPPTCVPCDVYMSNFSDATLPAHGLWQASTAVCTSDSWMCTAGYSRSNTSRYCCPNAVNHSVVNQSYSPCGVSCEYGYRWSNELASCLQCNTNMTEGTFRWLLDCDFECFCNDTVCYHGKETLGACYTCQEYSQKVGLVPPLYGEYPVYSNTCRVDDWQCKNDTFSKSLVATPPGCCLKSTPNAVANLSSPATCNLDCEPGYRWDPTRKQCFYCGIPFPRSAHMLWSSLTCSWLCELGYMKVDGSAGRFQCVNCPTHAVSNSWQLPSLAYWVNSTTLEQQGAICSTNAWQCADGYLKNAPAKLCCQNLSLPYSTGVGGLSTTSCDWTCNAGLFPPRLADINPACNLCGCTCEQYLQSYGFTSPCPIQYSFIGGWCDGMQITPSPAACSVSVQASFVLTGISLETFYLPSTVSAVLNALGGLSGISSVPSLTYSSSISTRRAAADTVYIGVTYLNVNPAVGQQYTLRVNTDGSRAVRSALFSKGYDVQVVMKGDSSVFVSGASISCRLHRKDISGQPTAAIGVVLRNTMYGGDEMSGVQEYNVQAKLLGVGQQQPNVSMEMYGRLRAVPQRHIVSLSCQRDKDVRVAHPLRELHDQCSVRLVLKPANSAGNGCPYDGVTLSSNCTCDKKTCPYECQYSSCSSCVQDNFCGWCSSASKCMPGDYFAPSAGMGACPLGWNVGPYATCQQSNNIWLVGIICASTSTALIVILCIHFILRIRAAANRRPRTMIFQYGDQSGGVTAREQVQRFLDTFPTFKFDENKLPPSFSASRSSEAEGQTEGQTDGQDEEDNRPTCSICLGNFFTGEDCRMLPCLHVFHKNCIDQWLSMSQECPLCKRSVISTDEDNTTAARANAFLVLQQMHSRGPEGEQQRPTSSSSAAMRAEEGNVQGVVECR